MEAVWGVICRGGASSLSYEKKSSTLSAALKLSPALEQAQQSLSHLRKRQTDTPAQICGK